MSRSNKPGVGPGLGFERYKNAGAPMCRGRRDRGTRGDSRPKRLTIAGSRRTKPATGGVTQSDSKAARYRHQLGVEEAFA